MANKNVSSDVVHMAIQAIELFYKKYEAQFHTDTIIAYTIALVQQTDLELTPLEKAFRRIMITRPHMRFSDKTRIAIVFGYNDVVDRAKTDELNELINRFTKNALVGQ